MTESLEQITTRNHAKEIDKAWETSWTRKLTIAIITYASALLFLWLIKVPEPYFAALVPVGGFLLSTSTLAPIKHWWVNRSSQN
jgi:hypothetical protein